MSAVVHPAVVAAPQPGLQLADRGVERGVEVGPAGLGAHGWALARAGDLDPLAGLGLAGVFLVVQFDVVADEVAVVPLEVGQFVGDVHPIVGGHIDVTTRHDNVHYGLSRLSEVFRFP